MLDIANDALREFAQRQRDAWAGLLAELTPETPSDPPADPPADPDPVEDPPADPNPEDPPTVPAEPADPPAPSELTLTHLGTVRLPTHGTVVIGGVTQQLYARGYQQLSPVHGATDEFWVTYLDAATTRGYVRHVGRLKLPATIGEGVLTSSPFATWVQAPVKVGDAFAAQLGTAASSARLMGVADNGDPDRIWLNYAQWYHVTSASYRNLSSISRTLDPATEVFRDRPTDEPPSISLGGWLSVPPQGWFADGLIFRGNSWQNGSDGGPRSSVFSAVDPTLKSQFATSYSVENRVDETWSQWDNWNQFFWLAAPTGERYAAVIARKGTAPGWYGGDTPPAGNTTNTKDVCDPAGPGRHAHPYAAEIWLFKVDDLLAVLSGAAPTHSPKPVKKIVLSEFGSCARISGGAVMGDVLWLVHDQGLKPTPNAVEYHNILRAYRIGWE